jgi:hypothetical protein
MKTFQIVTLFAMIAASMAFAPNAPKGEYFFGLSATKNGKKALEFVWLKPPRSVMWIFQYSHIIACSFFELINANIDTMGWIYRD